MTRLRTLAALAPVLAVVLALAGCFGGDPDESDADTLLRELAALEGVVQVAPTYDGVRPQVLTEVAVQTTEPEIEAFVALAELVVEVVDRRDGPPASVWRDGTGTSPGVRVALGAGDEPEQRLGQVRALAGLPGVTAIQVQGEADSVTVVAAGDLPAVAEVAQQYDVPLAMVTTASQRVSSYVPAGSFTPEVADLVAQVDGWDGVTGMFLSSQGATDGSLWLEVQVTGDDRVAEVAGLLSALTPPAGARLQFSVASSFREQGGVLGEPLPASDPTLAEASAAGDRWPDDPSVRTCTAADLDVRVVGSDAAAGSRFLLLRATSVAADPCALSGRPEITFVRASGTPAPDVETGTPSGSPAAVRQVLPPGASVRCELQWGAMSTTQDTDVTVSLLVAAEPGEQAVPVALERELDVLAGAQVQVGAWLRTVDGWADGEG
ncbi:DUF4232 domain-containing protein [Cellulomonas soli]|uniref:DUF4232 domain-containing protein n=1 Tax=Cellulomonas soli TaxID=931535 RepID=UPI003F85FD1A